MERRRRRVTILTVTSSLIYKSQVKKSLSLSFYSPPLLFVPDGERLQSAPTKHSHFRQATLSNNQNWLCRVATRLVHETNDTLDDFPKRKGKQALVALVSNRQGGGMAASNRLRFW